MRSLTDAALQQYLAQGEARRSVQLSLIAEIANIYLTLAADLESQRVAQATLDTQQALFDLIAKRHSAGAVSGLDIEQARTTVESARADVAYYAGRVAAGKNYLNLLAGRTVPGDRLPERFDLGVSGLQALPAGLPSEVLLRRPDVRQAEHLLRSANANIGAARAAFFPSISLTGSIGSASNQLSGLFESGTRVWRFMPSVNLPIFEGGRLRAQLGVATAERDIALARYEQAIQAGFRDVADALALTQTLAARRDAGRAKQPCRPVSGPGRRLDGRGRRSVSGALAAMPLPWLVVHGVQETFPWAHTAMLPAPFESGGVAACCTNR